MSYGAPFLIIFQIAVDVEFPKCGDSVRDSCRKLLAQALAMDADTDGVLNAYHVKKTLQNIRNCWIFVYIDRRIVCSLT